jgi:hypothetical protein
MALSAGQSLSISGELPELAAVAWRVRADERSLRRADRVWTLSAVAHELPFLATAVGLPLLNPVLLPVSVFALAFAWAIPELYASRGAGVLRAPRATGPGVLRAPGATGASTDAERRALGLLGDLVDHETRELLTATGMVLERGRFGVWLVAPAGALLVRPGGRRVQCYCVRVPDEGLPPADRVAHLLLALRADESGFATVANLSFSGAAWRLRRRLAPAARAGLTAATAAARTY